MCIRDRAWLGAFAADFGRRFCSLLSFRFRELKTTTALGVLEAASGASTPQPPLSHAELRFLLTPFDMKRLESYGNNVLELPIVLDLLPILAQLYFARRLRSADEADVERILHVSGLSSCLLYTSPSPRDRTRSRMPSSA